MRGIIPRLQKFVNCSCLITDGPKTRRVSRRITGFYVRDSSLERPSREGMIADTSLRAFLGHPRAVGFSLPLSVAVWIAAD
jgi:hypothetical protein